MVNYYYRIGSTKKSEENETYAPLKDVYYSKIHDGSTFIESSFHIETTERKLVLVERKKSLLKRDYDIAGTKC